MRGAVYTYGDVGEMRSLDRERLADAAQRATALGQLLHSISRGIGPVPDELRCELIAAARDVLNQVTAVSI